MRASMRGGEGAAGRDAAAKQGGVAACPGWPVVWGRRKQAPWHATRSIGCAGAGAGRGDEAYLENPHCGAGWDACASAGVRTTYVQSECSTAFRTAIVGTSADWPSAITQS